MSEFEREAMARFSEIAIRSLLILNGGAALGLLTFAGNAAANCKPATAFALAVLVFGMGAAASVSTAVLAVFAQSYLVRPNPRRNEIFYNLALGSGVASLLLFIFGVWAAWWNL